jgi:alanine dehydrogenase
MRILNATDVCKALPMKETIEVMKRAYAALTDGRVELPLRSRLPVPLHDGLCLIMPALVDDEDGQALAVKVVSVFNRNPALGLPLIHAAILVIDAATGKPAALLEGSSLTAIRTGASSGAAIDLLARPESKVVAVFGAGVQGRTQLEAACTVRNIEQAFVFDSDPVRAQAFAEELAGAGPIPKDLRAADSPEEAVTDADIICTATTSSSPVFTDAHLKPGVHISAIGAYTPEMQEIPGRTVKHARVIVDSQRAALAEAGDLLKPIEAGLITSGHIAAELGEIVLGRKTGRENAEQTTLFKSVGIAVQDAMASRLALQNAEKLKLGQEIEF